MKQPQKKKKTQPVLGEETLIAFCGAFSLYLRAGNSVEECFALMSREEASYLPRPVLEELYKRTDRGEPLTAALEETGVFPSYLRIMTETGERTGHLEEVCAALARYYTARRRLGQMLRGAVAYPLLLLTITILVIFLVLPKVLPLYSQIFADLGGSVPVVTYFLLQGAEGLQRAGWLVPAVLGCIALGCILLAVIPPWRSRVARWAAARFYGSKTGGKVNSAFFASLLTLGVTGGLDLDETMGLIQQGFADRLRGEQVAACRKKIAEGTPFAKAVGEAGLLSAVDSMLLDTGIRTGSTDRVLEEISRRTEEESEGAVEALMGRLEPTLVIVMSVLVGIMLAAVLFPLLGMMRAMTG